MNKFYHVWQKCGLCAAYLSLGCLVSTRCQDGQTRQGSREEEPRNERWQPYCFDLVSGKQDGQLWRGCSKTLSNFQRVLQNMWIWYFFEIHFGKCVELDMWHLQGQNVNNNQWFWKMMTYAKQITKLWWRWMYGSPLWEAICTIVKTHKYYRL